MKEIKRINNLDLKTISTIKIGGVADVVYFPRDTEELETLIISLADYKIIGNCSNVLWKGERIRTPLISLKDLKECEIVDDMIYAEAGVSLPLLAMFAEKHSLSGLEWASGIPASLGGAIYMNAGAFGFELGQQVLSVTYFENDRNKGFTIHTADSYEFSYRHSEFMNENRIILGATLGLVKEEQTKITATREEFAKKRVSSQPIGEPSLGSVFKRIDGEAVWSLIEGSGLRGYSIGGAMFSSKHCNFIVNTGNATADDVLALIKLAKEKVFAKYGIKLQEEIEVVE